MSIVNLKKLSRNKLFPKNSRQFKNYLNKTTKKSNTVYSTSNLLNYVNRDKCLKDYSRDNNIHAYKLKQINHSSSINNNNKNIMNNKKYLNKSINNYRNYSANNNNSFDLIKYMNQVMKTPAQFNKKNIINIIEKTTINYFINSMNITNKSLKNADIASIYKKKDKTRNRKINLKFNNKRNILNNCTNKTIMNINIKNKQSLNKSKNSINNIENNNDDIKIEEIEEIEKENEKLKMKIEEENKTKKKYIDKIINLKNKQINLNRQKHKLKNDNRIYYKTLEKLLGLLELLEENGLELSEIISFYESEDDDSDNVEKNKKDYKNNKNGKDKDKGNNNNNENSKDKLNMSYGVLEVHNEFSGSKIPVGKINKIPKLKFH